MMMIHERNDLFPCGDNSAVWPKGYHLRRSGAKSGSNEAVPTSLRVLSDPQVERSGYDRIRSPISFLGIELAWKTGFHCRKTLQSIHSDGA